MPSRWQLLLAVALAAIVVVAVVLVYPRPTSESPVIVLSSSQTPGWSEVFCIPEGLLFTYSWNTSDGSSGTVTAQGPQPVEWTSGSSGIGGEGRQLSDGTMVFNGTVDHPSVQIILHLSFTPQSTYLWGTPHSGPGPC
jgi:hypothetical protein